MSEWHEARAGVAAYLERQQVRERLDRVRAAIDKVAKEQEARWRHVDAHLPQRVREELQILVVPVQVAENVHR